MHRMLGIHADRSQSIHLDRIGRHNLTTVIRDGLEDDPIILHHESPDRHRHPAVLTLVVVN
jgi:hypothetical protein